MNQRKNVQILAFAHALKQNIVQFTTDTGSKSILIVRNSFAAKFSGIWRQSTQKNCFNGKKCVFLSRLGKGLVEPPSSDHPKCQAQVVVLQEVVAYES